MLFIGLLMKIGYKLVTFYCSSEEHICFETFVTLLNVLSLCPFLNGSGTDVNRQMLNTSSSFSHVEIVLYVG